ncbi:hypothetical protein K6V92_00330 [Cupriavidus respiraculi]|uniref:hypothetical protein n=1 Tax=Cupriavidus respiraculi TaxID=195930 RepID=UPI001C9641EE|nr:hypothetical protein [Cupriavidus respiraculi]MBY4945070.1 hypothetical protein [Cupriavidus respiraculi]
MEQPSEARERLNLSISPELRIALQAAATVMGITPSQLAVQILIAGMPKVAEEMQAVGGLTKLGREMMKVQERQQKGGR